MFASVDRARHEGWEVSVSMAVPPAFFCASPPDGRSTGVSRHDQFDRVRRLHERTDTNPTTPTAGHPNLSQKRIATRSDTHLPRPCSDERRPDRGSSPRARAMQPRVRAPQEVVRRNEYRPHEGSNPAKSPACSVRCRSRQAPTAPPSQGKASDAVHVGADLPCRPSAVDGL